jgi:hypothetical protein
MKAVKITNAAWLPMISEEIDKFCKKAHVNGIQSGNLQTFFAQVAQGWMGNTAEFWAVLNSDKPVAFAMWQALGLPHIAKVYCLALHSWGKKKLEPTNMLLDEYIKFGERWKAVWFSADLINKRLVDTFKHRMGKRGFDMIESNIINVVCRRRK